MKNYDTTSESAFCNYDLGFDHGYHEGFSHGFKACEDRIPESDIVHAHWEKRGNVCKCTECLSETPISPSGFDYTYCPWCGSIMDEMENKVVMNGKI